MKTIHLKTILFSLLLMTGNPIAFANEDPCSAVASADKLDCIKMRIEEAEASVESQFTRLSQPGPQGVKGKKARWGCQVKQAIVVERETPAQRYSILISAIMH